MSARLFVALDLPAEVRAELAAWCERAAPDGVRRVPEENLHVTLAFLGPRPVEEVAAAGRLLAPLASACAVGPLATAGELWLPPRRPGVLTVALAGDDRLGALQSALVERLREAIGFEPERRAFRPHVTVGRIARGARVTARTLTPAPALTFDARALTLYRSRTGSGGARYEAQASVPVASSVG